MEDPVRLQKKLSSFWTSCCLHSTFCRWAPDSDVHSSLTSSLFLMLINLAPHAYLCCVPTLSQRFISHHNFLQQEGFSSSELFLYKFLNVWDGSLLRPQILGLLSNIPVVPSSRECYLHRSLLSMTVFLHSSIFSPYVCQRTLTQHRFSLWPCRALE